MERNNPLDDMVVLEPDGGYAHALTAFEVSVNLTAADLALLTPDQVSALYGAIGTLMAITSRH